VGHEESSAKHATASSDRKSDVAKLNQLGVKVPANGFSKQELHDMAVRLEK